MHRPGAARRMAGAARRHRSERRRRHRHQHQGGQPGRPPEVRRDADRGAAAAEAEARRPLGDRPEAGRPRAPRQLPRRRSARTNASRSTSSATSTGATRRSSTCTTRSELRKEIEQRGGRTLNFPDVADRVAEAINRERMPIHRAREELPFGSRVELSADGRANTGRCSPR